MIAKEVLMIKPCNFNFNEETAVNNAYQKNEKEAREKIEKTAISEFDALVKKIEDNGVKVHVLMDTPCPYTPDSIFPNNWFSTHVGKVVTYPMFAENRREERNKFINQVMEILGLEEKDRIDFSDFEKEGLYLEGTGALVLDRANKYAYCTLSPRASEKVLMEFCKKLDYKPVVFKAYQEFSGKEISIYHTNVMMGLGEKFAVICLSAIKDKKERDMVEDTLKKSGKKIVDITFDQVSHFAGNVLEVMNENGEKIVLMSESAYKALTDEQKLIIEEESKILYSPIPTIETYGGGSVRCMVAEIYR